MDSLQQKFVEVKAHFGPNHPEYHKTSLQVVELYNQLQRARENIANVWTWSIASWQPGTDAAQAVAPNQGGVRPLNVRSFEYQAKEARSRRRQDTI